MATITLFYWLHTCPRTGKRRRTRHRLTEDDAKAQLHDPVRVEFDALTIEPLDTTASGVWRSGLVADAEPVPPWDWRKGSK